MTVGAGATAAASLGLFVPQATRPMALGLAAGSLWMLLSALLAMWLGVDTLFPKPGCRPHPGRLVMAPAGSLVLALALVWLKLSPAGLALGVGIAIGIFFMEFRTLQQQLLRAS